MQIDVPVVNRQRSNNKHASLTTQDCGDNFKQFFDYQKYPLARVLWASADSILRIIPANDGSHTIKQNINVDNWQEDADQLQYLSDTFYMTRTVSRFGDSKMEFISNLRPGSEEAAYYPESPINYFCSLVNRVMQQVAQGKKTKVKWLDCWKGWVGMQGTVPFSRVTLFMQAICIKMNGRMCKQSTEDDSPDAPLYGLVGINHKSSIEALVKALVKPMDRRKPIGPENNEFGALAEAKGNLLYLNTSLNPEQRKYLAPSIQAPDAPANKWEPTEYNLSEYVCMGLFVPWDKLLRYYTVEEQLELIAAEFGPDTVNYIFSLDEAWSGLPIPENIAKYGLGRYDGKAKASVPGGSFIPPQISKTPAKQFTPPKAEPAAVGVGMKMGDVMSADTDKLKAELAKIKAAAKPKAETKAEPSWMPPNAASSLANDLMAEADNLDDLGEIDDE